MQLRQEKDSPVITRWNLAMYFIFRKSVGLAGRSMRRLERWPIKGEKGSCVYRGLGDNELYTGGYIWNKKSRIDQWICMMADLFG